MSSLARTIQKRILSQKGVVREDYVIINDNPVRVPPGTRARYIKPDGTITQGWPKP
jgi:hypothetical protein